jgi:hypothetical protein
MMKPCFPGTGMAYGTSAFLSFASGAADAVRTLRSSGGPSVKTGAATELCGCIKLFGLH